MFASLVAADVRRRNLIREEIRLLTSAATRLELARGILLSSSSAPCYTIFPYGFHLSQPRENPDWCRASPPFTRFSALARTAGRGHCGYRRSLGLRGEIFADVHVKHATPLGNIPIQIAARDTLERGLADALIISGTGTGVPTELREVQAVREVCRKARILIGSGITAENV